MNPTFKHNAEARSAPLRVAAIASDCAARKIQAGSLLARLPVLARARAFPKAAGLTSPPACAFATHTANSKACTFNRISIASPSSFRHCTKEARLQANFFHILHKGKKLASRLLSHTIQRKETCKQMLFTHYTNTLHKRKTLASILHSRITQKKEACKQISFTHCTKDRGLQASGGHRSKVRTSTRDIIWWLEFKLSRSSEKGGRKSKEHK